MIVVSAKIGVPLAVVLLGAAAAMFYFGIKTRKDDKVRKSFLLAGASVSVLLALLALLVTLRIRVPRFRRRQNASGMAPAATIFS